ncbi:hypothetical protein GE253_06930 [Niveispirillum sp. SYP-B3756]|uniref:hypothetical protein n=1 Tax=Niveispirillum sp. SYP-B3756 TaxID=2662178 RepID=UPI00129229CF|nr:hypothetical protein [Niveispirillum sp. SYP-B3756]MQP65079.1 hypothetical protein [Niveispirillum sp. SYP-B3756]
MSNIAFQGDPAIKQLALSRLRHHITADTFVIYPAWAEGKANIIGAVVEADDHQLYAEMLGYPLPLVMAVESIVNAFRMKEGAEFAEAWLEQTPVGADLSQVVAQILASILEEPALVALTRGHEGLEQSRLSVIALHRRMLAGEEPDRREWKLARLAAVAATDTVTDDSFLRAAGAIIEAAAWPGTMRTVLRDTLGARGGLETKQVMQEIDWTEADESRVFKIVSGAEGQLTELSGLERVYALLEADDPKLPPRFRERVRQYEKLGAAYKAIGWKIVKFLEQAPVRS